MHLSFFNVERFKKQPLKTTFLVGINKIPLKLEFLSFYYYKRKGFKTPKKKKNQTSNKQSRWNDYNAAFLHYNLGLKTFI